jgi:hypothetical protein
MKTAKKILAWVFWIGLAFLWLTDPICFLLGLPDPPLEDEDGEDIKRNLLKKGAMR